MYAMQIVGNIRSLHAHTSLNLRWLSCTKKRKTEPREPEQVGEAVEAVEDALGGGKVQPSFEGEAGEGGTDPVAEERDGLAHAQ